MAAAQKHARPGRVIEADSVCGRSASGAGKDVGTRTPTITLKT